MDYNTRANALARVLQRIPGARRASRGWTAKCPGHDDSSPSLSISQGRTGVLLRCFAGCRTSDIAAAMHLTLADLFDGDRKQPACTRRVASPSSDDVRAALKGEADAFLKDLRARGTDGRLLTAEVNAIRKRVALRLGVSLPPLPIPLSDGSYGGYERDPWWPAVFEYGLRLASVEILGKTIGELRPPRSVVMRAEDIAGNIMREMGRAARRYQMRRAA